MSYAEKTQVPIDHSKAEIERILLRYGADQFVYGMSVPDNTAVIKFRYTKYYFMIKLPLPNPDDFKDSPKGRTRKQSSQQQAWEQAMRQRWRALALYVKPTLEAIESGITTLEEAFMSNILLPNGRSVKEHALPEIQMAYETGKMPKLITGI